MTAVSALAAVVPEEVLAPRVESERWAALGAAPEAVVRPSSSDEVAAILEWASAEGVRVVPAGSGRRLRAVEHDERFLVLSSERLGGFEIYEPADLTFTAGAGTTLRDVEARLLPNGQWLPFDPPDMLGRTLGGLVAVGDSGPLATGYGPLRNHVLGMTVVTGDGRTLRLGGRVVKNVAGFDLLKPLVGSRGRLAVITSVCMRAFPRPAVDRVLVVRGASLAELAPLALAVGAAPVLPVSCVLRVAAPDAGPANVELRVRLHGAEATVEADRLTLERHLGRSFELGEANAGDPNPAGSVALTLSALPSRLPDVIGAIERAEPAGVAIDAYRGRVRVVLPGWSAAATRALRDAIESLGGALNVERAPVDADVAGASSRPRAEEAALAERLARTFDPAGVLWQPTL